MRIVPQLKFITVIIVIFPDPGKTAGVALLSPELHLRVVRKNLVGQTWFKRWKTFVHNHASALVACDFAMVVTATFPQTLRAGSDGNRFAENPSLQCHCTSNGGMDGPAVPRSDPKRSLISVPDP